MLVSSSKQLETSFPTWNMRNKEVVKQYFSLLKRHSFIDDEQKQKKALQEQGLLINEQFSIEGTLFFSQSTTLYTDVKIVDKTNSLYLPNNLIEGSLIEIRHQLMQILKKVWQNAYSSSEEPRDKHGKEKIYYDYPKEVILEAINVFLASIDYLVPKPALITVTDLWVEFASAFNPNPKLLAVFKELDGSNESSNSSDKYIREILKENGSYSRDGTSALEVGQESFRIYRRSNKHKTNNLGYKQEIPSPEMVLIPAGSFWMGSEERDLTAAGNEKSQQLVHIDDFWIGRYPITNQQYAQFLQQSEHPAPPHWNNERPVQDKPDHPVVNVSYDDASAYCIWLSQQTGQPFRLPSEKEWEKAAKGDATEKRIYVWGNEWRATSANTEEFGAKTTTPVTTFEQVNKSPYGVVDMLGNVWEWTTSRYKKYDNDTRLVVRGGSWINDHRLAHISTKGRYEPGTKRPYLGFRIATDVLTSQPPKPTELKINRGKFLTLLRKNFSMEDLQEICFHLEINSDDFTQKASVMSREIIEYCMHYRSLDELLTLCRELRPKTNWDSIFS